MGPIADHQKTTHYQSLYAFTTSMVVGLVILVLVWIFYYRDSFTWLSILSREFYWHPFLMLMGIIFLYSQSIFIYRTFRKARKRRLSILHATLHCLAFILSVIGLKAVFDSYDLAEEPITNLYSLHSWVGLITVIIFAAQSKISFPEEVLTLQICSNCGQYLSVGPITISPGDDGMVCGRCPKGSLAVNSLYNIIAEKCLFKCVNHYAGCEQLLLFTEAEDHEKDCKYPNYVCPFCKYEGNGCQLVAHFKKFHTTYIVQGDTFEHIISYKDLNIANFISDMGINDLKLFVNTASKLFMECVDCKRQFREGSIIYVCPKYHAACDDCCTTKCPKCSMCQWSSKSKLHRILLECEWENCSEKTNVFTYMSHKHFCKFKQYRCPDEDCGYVCNLEELRRHWHMNRVRIGREITIRSSVAFYWLVPDRSRLQYVSVEYDGNHELMTFAISEISSVLPFNFGSMFSGYIRTDNAFGSYSMPQLKYSPLKPVRYIKFPNYYNRYVSYELFLQRVSY